MEVKWSKDFEFHRETLVIWDGYEIQWRINPGRKPTEQELTACPKAFTCFACLEKHPQRELGGRYHEKWFCLLCIPYIDEWTAGAMVWWEERRKKRHYGRHKPSKPHTKLERLQSLVAVVRWAKANGYPIK
jgi:hypothetical protein